jgi:hypothetical protein
MTHPFKSPPLFAKCLQLLLWSKSMCSLALAERLQSLRVCSLRADPRGRLETWVLCKTDRGSIGHCPLGNRP